jgi:hypothetical protein
MMFSEGGATQELIALGVAVLAFVYLAWKVFGSTIERKKKPTGGVVLGGRLKRGLDSARRRDDVG